MRSTVKAIVVSDPERAVYLRHRITPWWRRIYFGLNYLPVLIVGVFGILVLLGMAGVSSPVVALLVSALAVAAFGDALGRRPYVRRLGSKLEIRNITRVYTIPIDSITAVTRYTFRLRKDSCPAIKTGDEVIPVTAYFGLDREQLSLALGRKR